MKWGEDILAFFTLCFISYLWSSHISYYVAEPDPWDEAWQLLRAYRDNWSFFFDPDFAPLMGVWFKILKPFSSDRLDLYYLHLQTLAFLLPVSLFLFCRALKLSVFLSMVAALLYCAFPLLTVASRQVTHLGALIFFLGGAFAFSRKTTLSKLLVLDFVLLLTSLVRPEYQLSLMAINVVLVICAGRELWKKGPKQFLPYLVILPLGLQIAYSMQKQGVTNKAIYVYRDYAHRRYLDSGLSGDKFELFERHYGKISDQDNKFYELLFRNPGDLFAHFLYSWPIFWKNIFVCFRSFRYLFESYFGMIFLGLFFVSLIFLRYEKKLRSPESFKWNSLAVALSITPIFAAGLLFGVNTRYFVGVVGIVLFAIMLFFERWKYPRFASLIPASIFLVAGLLLPPDFYGFWYLKLLFGCDNGAAAMSTGVREMASAFKKIPHLDLKIASQDFSFLYVDRIDESKLINCMIGKECPFPAERENSLQSYMLKHKIDIVRIAPILISLMEDTQKSAFTQDVRRLVKTREDGVLNIIQVKCFPTYLVFFKNHPLADKINAEITKLNTNKDLACPGTII
jgi:hypothetical protein